MEEKQKFSLDYLIRKIRENKLRQKSKQRSLRFPDFFSIKTLHRKHQFEFEFFSEKCEREKQNIKSV